MVAVSRCAPAGPHGLRQGPSGWRSALVLGIFLWLALGLLAQAVEGDSAARARKDFEKAQGRYREAPQNSEAAWQFARACFDLAEFATNTAERADLAQEGISACREVVARERASVPAHYYLGMNLGQLARTRGLSALKIVDQMEHEFSLASELDEQFDYGGPDRNLGLLYRDAPAIGSIGSRAKARQHLQRAVNVAPHYLENRLDLIEGCLKWGDRNGARRELKALEEILPAARTEFTGPAWADSWTDWDARLEKLKKKIEGPPKTIESPRQKQ